ncbi:MAG: beta-N-acetylhexosaminidase [Alphaproteobacteria bacterium]|nr:MAG: beta-N-acetylhexosaminidase [Alphaproteobacteria bacterium]
MPADPRTQAQLHRGAGAVREDAAALILGVAGTQLSADERALFRERPPAGLILFARNIRDRDQLRALISAFREIAGEQALVLVDQEGGRVQRLKPPLVENLPAMRHFGLIAESGDFVRAAAALELAIRLQAQDLAALDIDVNCAPVLDLLIAGADPVIGDRAFSSDPDIVSRLGRVAMEAMLTAGILPVIKHIPGHGRAGQDTHLGPAVIDAPREVLARDDFLPFRNLADAPAAMTAHVIYTALDREQPASLSPVVLEGLIRRDFGFAGLLLSDDLAMGALTGRMGERVRRACDAGCDFALVCSGRMADNEEALACADPISDKTRARLEAARRRLGQARIADRATARERLRRLLAGAPTREEEVGEGAA